MKLAMIGFGGMAHYHCGLINECKLFDIVGIYDIDEKQQYSAREMGIKVFNSPQEVYESDAEVVLIATPNDVHFEYVVACLKAKKNVICEKPACMSVEEYRIMAKTSLENNVLMSVHQNRRYDADYLTMLNIVNSGVIGKVYCVESRVMASNDIPGGWRKIASKGGGMMLDWGVHLIDQANLMFDIQDFDCDYSYIFGHEVEDGFNINLYGDEIKYSITVDTNCFIPLPRWQIYGTNGTAVIKDWDLNGEIIRDKNGGNNIIGITAGNGFTKTMAGRDVASIEKLPLPKIEVDKFIYYKNFINAVKNNTPFILHNQVEKVLGIMDKANKTARKNYKF